MDKNATLVSMVTYAQVYLEQRIEETVHEEMKMDYIHELEDIKELFHELRRKHFEGAL